MSWQHTRLSMGDQAGLGMSWQHTGRGVGLETGWGMRWQHTRLGMGDQAGLGMCRAGSRDRGDVAESGRNGHAECLWDGRPPGLGKLLGDGTIEEFCFRFVAAGLMRQHRIFFDPDKACSGWRSGRLILGVEDRIIGNFHIVAELRIKIKAGVIRDGRIAEPSTEQKRVRHVGGIRYNF